jgi:hypothetical protein
MRFVGHKFVFVLSGAAACVLTVGCQLNVNQSELNQTLLTFAEDVFREILAAYLL